MPNFSGKEDLREISGGTFSSFREMALQSGNHQTNVSRTGRSGFS
jgi:hypothetical protein